MTSVRGKSVFVGLSGGVDSAVTAALLKRAGAKVYGVFIKGWYPEGLPCTWAEDRRDAMRVAARLQIPFTTLDGSTAYKQSVIDYLLKEYASGRTPNPDIMCNRDVKFGVFHEFARSHGADFIATGHYARNKGGVLHRGVDESKDQSYFLWAVPKEVLANTLFPLGEMEKSEVRTLAQSFNLPTAHKRDSQGICFLGAISIDEFLRSEFEITPGIAVDEAGATVGTHEGAMLYTIGERVALHDAAPGPWQVRAKHLKENVIVVGKGQADPLVLSSIQLTDTNWFSVPNSDELLTAQYRYHGPQMRGTVSEDTHAFLPGEQVPEPLAPGQSLVMYRKDEVVGGGIMA